MNSPKQQVFYDHLFPDLRDGDLTIPRAGSIHNKTHQSNYISRDIYAISLVLEGKGQWQKDDGPIFPIQKGSSFLTHPGHRYRFGPDPKHPWKEHFIVFQGSRPSRWVEDGMLPEEDRPQNLPQYLKLHRLFEQLFSMDQFNSQFRKHLTLNLIEQLLIERSIQLEGREARFPDLVDKVIRLCWKNQSGQIDFESLAQSNGVSYSYLRKTFREHVGVPPQKFLNKVRARKAQNLLDDHNLSVSEVAERMNYSDLFTFSRQFKTATGLSPTAYRTK